MKTHQIDTGKRQRPKSMAQRIRELTSSGEQTIGNSETKISGFVKIDADERYKWVRQAANCRTGSKRRPTFSNSSANNLICCSCPAWPQTEVRTWKHLTRPEQVFRAWVNVDASLLQVRLQNAVGQQVNRPR
jgi:hypothetical protein